MIHHRFKRAGWLSAALVGALLLMSGAAPARAHDPVEIDSAVKGALTAAAAGDMVDVIVVLRRQAALASDPTATRRQRLLAVETALRDTAESAQQRIRDLLALRRSQGLVARVRPFWIFNGLRVLAAPSVISELAALPEVRAIRPNSTIQAPSAPATSAGAEWNVAHVNAPALWGLGYRGQGLVVANMDTGVDVTHPDLSARWRGGANSWFDPNGEHPSTPTDVNGHGTWTMGVMVGGDAGGTSVGVAPDARWIAVKIFNDHGSATSAGIHAGFEWLLDPDNDPVTLDAPNVVNNSWSMASPGCNLTFELDLQSLRAAGILPVFAAGNGGPFGGTSLSPANNPEALPVGGTDSGDLIDPGSSRGPSACDQSIYPQLVAPGVSVRTTDMFGLYTDVTGTSIAAPHAAGVLTLLLGRFPATDADRQARSLQSGAADLGAAGPDNTYGNGLLDALASYNWLATAPDFSVSASPASASTPAGGSVSYTVDVAAFNGFSGEIALSLSGLSSTQAGWTFSPAAITDGSGSSQLTVTATGSLAPGSYPFTITGTSGSMTRSVTVALDVSPPPDFTVSATPASATAPPGGSVSYSVAVSALNGFGGDVALSLSGLSSAQASWTFSPATVSGGSGSSQLTLAVAGALAPGSYALTITGTSGSIAHTTSVTLVVSQPPDFALSVAPTSATVSTGKSVSYTVTVASIGGFTGSVALSLSGQPSPSNVTFTPNPVQAPGTSKLSIKTSGGTTRGTFQLKITGKSGALVHEAVATLTVVK